MTLKEKIKKIPLIGWIAGPALFAMEGFFYFVGSFLSEKLGTIAWSFSPKIAALDDCIPVVATFILIYFFSYIFWIMGPIVVSLTTREHFINYVIGLTLAYIIGFVVFLFLPSYMDRVEEGLLEYEGKPNIIESILLFCYKTDGWERGSNLFPSYHCLVSVYCYLGVMRRKEISRGYRIYSLVMAILICLSTVFTKQHYVLDVISGAFIAVICYLVTEKINPGKTISERRESSKSR